MYFLLGVLLATLVALLVLPAVWHRAVRLTTKRVEAAVPVSLFEVQADKDQQRAFFALNQRRLELQLDDMRATIAAHAATIESQRLRILELEGVVGDLTQTGEKTGAVAAERQVLVGELQDQVSDLKARIATLEGELAGARAAFATLESEHGSLSEKHQGLATTLSERDASLVEHGDRATSLESEIALLTTNLTATTHRLEVSDDLLGKERAAVARLTGELGETRDNLAAKEEESATRAANVEALTAERDRLQAELATARGDLDASRAILHTFEQRRASEFAEAEAETRRISSTLDRMRADHALMAGALEKARADGEPAPAAEPSGDVAQVKEALADVAARIVTLATRLEGDASPVPALVEGAADDAMAEVPSLATRIRALLDAPADVDAAAKGAAFTNGGHGAEVPAPEGTESGEEADSLGEASDADTAVMVEATATTSRKGRRKQAST